MTVHFGAFTLDIGARQLLRDGEGLHLSPKAFDLLTMLVERRPAVVEKADLRARLWPGVHVVDAALTNLVAEIRAVLEDDADSIRTVHGIGYAFAAPVHEGRATSFWVVVNDRPLVLSAGDHVVGRDPACGVWVDAEGVSRRHARIRIRSSANGDAATIEDLSSTNGTYVQRRRVVGETRLADGDRIQVGHATLVFHAGGASAATKRVGRKARKVDMKS